MTNSADPDQLASSEANWSVSTLFAKTGHAVFSKRRIKFHCLHEETLHSWLSKMHPVKILIRLCKCAGWSESVLGTHDQRYIFWCFFFSHILWIQIKFPCWSNSNEYIPTTCFHTGVLQKVLSLGSDYFSATFYQTYFYYKPSKYSPFTETHFCNLFT